MSIRFEGNELPSRAFPKHGGAGSTDVTPGYIVENKYLAGALIYAREQQQLRDTERLKTARTHRERALIQATASG